MNVLDLFSGIGGFSLGLERAGMRTVAFCEIEPYCQAVLRKHWPDVPIFRDVREVAGWLLAGNGLLDIDLICGGFPCQDISVAGKGAGIDGERSGLWSEFARIIGEVRPCYVIVENVSALLGRGLGRVLGDLAALGYDAEWHCIPASAVGAPHRRDRVWIVAHAESSQRRPLDSSRGPIQRTDGLSQRQESPSRSKSNGEALADADSGRRESGGECAQEWSIPKPQSSGEVGSEGYISDARRQSAERYGSSLRALIERNRWEPEPDVGGSPDGFPLWLDRYVGRGLNYAESCRRSQALRELWSDNVSQALRRAVGGLERLQQAQVLFSFVREYENGSDQARLLVEGKEASDAFLRGLRDCAIAGSASHRPRQNKQQFEEYSDPLQPLSRLLARPSESHWAGNGWEDATPRIATGVYKRVDRLRSLGNAIVPQIAEIIGRAIMAERVSC